VIEEAMRLYPPAHTISRTAVAADRIGGVPIPAGAVITKPVVAASLWQAIAPGSTAAPAARRNQAAGPRGVRILLAEDNIVNQTVTRRMLEKLGYEVVIAADGAAAVATLDSQPFDIVLMDVQMPVMDGLEATRRIRRHELGGASHTPIIAMTANAMKEARDICLDAGMDGYVTKPISLEGLTNALEEAMSHARV